MTRLHQRLSHAEITAFRELSSGIVGSCGISQKMGNFRKQVGKSNEKLIEINPILSKDEIFWARFSKLSVITGPVKLFCFPFQTGVSKVLKIAQ